MNALVTRNREHINKRVEAVLTCEQQMGLREGETPLAILFFSPAKSVTFRGVFFIDVIYFFKWAVYHPLVSAGEC